jgi:hypothetical protein
MLLGTSNKPLRTSRVIRPSEANGWSGMEPNNRSVPIARCALSMEVIAIKTKQQPSLRLPRRGVIPVASTIDAK